VADLLRPLFTYVEEQWHLVALHSVSTVVAFCLITFLSVVFGELIPKTIGLQDSERTALLVANPLLTFTRLTGPLVAFMDGVGNRILRRFGYELEGEGEKAHSVEELILLIEDTAEAGVISEHQAKFVRNILRLSQRKVADVIIPMEKVGKLDYEASPELILQRVREGTFTRMPVYHRDVNHILGVANTKQMLRLFAERGKVALEEVLYPAVFVAPDDPLPLAMSRMREAKFPLAVVRDAAGTVHGVVAVEDVVEQVMGEFTDEHDYPAPKVTPRMLQALIKAVPRRKLDAPGKAEPAAAV
jgi:CBS domain containing-hemolysin-like protein